MAFLVVRQAEDKPPDGLPNHRVCIGLVDQSLMGAAPRHRIEPCIKDADNNVAA